MKKIVLLLVVVFTSAVNCVGFYKESEFVQKNINTVTPTNLEELRKALCNNVVQDQCLDTEKRRIILNKLFDFTNTEGTKEEDGCFYTTDPEKCNFFGKDGQMKLNINNKCQDQKNSPKKVSYDVAGLKGLLVGSNKVVECMVTESSMSCGISGKGLRLKNVYNVEINKLFIGNINPAVIGGGVGIELSNVRNVAILSNVFENIGDYMVASNGGGSRAVALNLNKFEGKTKYSASCDGNTNWMLQFNGEGDIISMEFNIIGNAYGPVLRMKTPNNAKSHIYLTGNTCGNILTSKKGFIDLDGPNSSIYAEGNCFPVGTNMINNNNGAITMPASCNDALACKVAIGTKVICNLGIALAGIPNNLKGIEDYKELSQKLKSEQVTKDLAENDWSKLENMKVADKGNSVNQESDSISADGKKVQNEEKKNPKTLLQRILEIIQSIINKILRRK